MKKYIRQTRSLSVLLILSVMFSYSSYAQQYDSVFTKEIAPGIIHKRVVDVKDTIIANILRIDLKERQYTLKAAKAAGNLLGRKKTSEIVSSMQEAGYNVIAAVNSDFFNMKTGEVENNMVIDGEFLKAVTITDSPFDLFNNIHSQFALTDDNRPMIDRFFFKGELIVPSKKVYKISRINSVSDSNSITLYNHFQGNATPQLPESWSVKEFQLVPVKIKADTNIFKVSKVYDKKGSNPIENDRSLVLSVNNSVLKNIQDNIGENDTVKIISQLIPGGSSIKTLIGGWPKIVTNGRNIAHDADWLEGTFPKFSKEKHPRTGIGFTEDQSALFLITVDGRQESSSGVSLETFADIMLKEGIYQGLNFDGGGSTTMVINGKIVNHPSDKAGERPVGNCLLLIQDSTKITGSGK